MSTHTLYICDDSIQKEIALEQMNETHDTMWARHSNLE